MSRRGGRMRRSEQADSIVIDPHKHGLQPYGCGCVLFRDPGVGRFYKHDSPYTYFTSKELHLGEISLECSRAGAAAVALWATQRLLPLKPGGEFAQGLAQGRAAALELDRRLRADGRFGALAAGGPELDIVVWKMKAATAEQASGWATIDFFSMRRARSAPGASTIAAILVWDRPAMASTVDEHVTCLRSVLMKPEHRGVAGPHLGELTAPVYGVLGGSMGMAESMSDWGCKIENVLIRAGDCAVDGASPIRRKDRVDPDWRTENCCRRPSPISRRARRRWRLMRATPADGTSVCRRWRRAR